MAMEEFHNMFYCLGGGFIRFCDFVMGIFVVVVECLFFVSGGWWLSQQMVQCVVWV